VRRASRVACRLAVLEVPTGARMRLSAPLVPPPATQLAVAPLTVKVCGKAGAQDKSCCPLTVIDVMVFALPAVSIWMIPVALVVPTVEELTVMALPFAVVPVAIAVMTTFAPLCTAT